MRACLSGLRSCWFGRGEKFQSVGAWIERGAVTEFLYVFCKPLHLAAHISNGCNRLVCSGSRKDIANGKAVVLMFSIIDI